MAWRGYRVSHSTRLLLKFLSFFAIRSLASAKALSTKASGSEPDQWFDVDGLRAYHPDHPARKTIYDWVTLRRVPYHKDGKRLRFLKSEIDAWLAGGYHKTDDEMQEAAVDYVNAIRGGAR